MSEELSSLISERADARNTFSKARFLRDAAVVYYESVATRGTRVTRPAWDAFTAKQTEMDVAGDQLDTACGNVVEHVLPVA
jgi:hypothetical protein